MGNKVSVGKFYQAINPNCQFKVIEYIGKYKERHYYNVQILNSVDIYPLTEHQILSGNFKIPTKESIRKIKKSFKKKI